jgi:5-methylcytosine-specific restriction endonuclease McrA
MKAKHNRYDEGYKLWRKKVIARDNKRCQMPGCKKKVRKVEVHHIRTYAKNPLLRTDITNGITLCKTCHYMIRNKEQFYAQLFDDILREKRRSKR